MKLTKDTKSKIIKAAIDTTLGTRLEVLESKRLKLGEDVYQHRYAAHLQHMNKLPDGFLPNVESMRVQFGESGCDFTRLPLFEQRRGGCNLGAVKFSNDHPYTKRYKELQKESDTIKEDEKTLRRQLTGVVDPCTTLNKLLTVWPEAEQFLPPVAKVENLPAVPIEDLRRNLERMKEVK